jgi:hypothetical protein
MHALASQALFDAQTAQIKGRLAAIRAWNINELAYPIIDLTFTSPGRTPLRLAARCDDWNSQPPSFALLAADGTRLRSGGALKEISPNPTSVFNAGAHPLTGFLFIGSAGSREYHTHTSHTNDPWDSYRSRSGYDLGGILTRYWHAWLKGTA